MLCHDAVVRAILDRACTMTAMELAAVARVTDTRWIACRVLDKIEFGLEAGDELDLKTTICGEIRDSGKAVDIDHVAADTDWRTHSTPALFGFQSCAYLRSSSTTAARDGLRPACRQLARHRRGIEIAALRLGRRSSATCTQSILELPPRLVQPI